MIYLPHVRFAAAVYEDALVLGGDLAVPVWHARWPWVALLRLTGGSILHGHAVSLALHLLNGLLLYALARRCVSALSATFAAALWWLHPLQTESVAYLAAQGDLLATTWGLIGLLLIDADQPLLGLLAAGVMVWTKELAAGAVLLLPLWAWWRHRGWSCTAWACWGLAGLVGLVWGVQQVAWSHTGLLVPAWSPDAMAVRLVQGVVLLAHVVWPVGLTIDHDWAWLTPQGAALILTWLGVAWWLVRRTWGAWAIPAALCVLAPRAILPLYEGVHEHHLPLALIGFALWGGSLVERHA